MEAIARKCINIILKNEGGYVNHPNDPGGATNFGISKRSFPKLDIKNLKKEEAIQIYYEKYWSIMHLDLIDEEELKLHLFDQGVNSGTRKAVRMLQKHLGLVPDGLIGKITAAAITEHKITAEDYKLIRIARYKRLVQLKPKFKVFENGWINRVKHTTLK